MCCVCPGRSGVVERAPLYQNSICNICCYMQSSILVHSCEKITLIYFVVMKLLLCAIILDVGFRFLGLCLSRSSQTSLCCFEYRHVVICGPTEMKTSL